MPSTYRRLGQDRMAMRQLSLAVTLATPGRLVQPFKVRRNSLAGLLEGMNASTFGVIQPAERTFVQHLRSSLQGMPLPAGDGGVATPGLLSGRELQLLSCSTTGSTTNRWLTVWCYRWPP